MGRNLEVFLNWSCSFLPIFIKYSIASLTVSRCLSGWDNKANWIDSREMWNFNTNRAEPVTRHRSRTGDQRDKLNIYISGVHPVYSSDWARPFNFTDCRLFSVTWPPVEGLTPGVVSTKGPWLDWVHFWQLCCCCNEELCLLRVLWLSQTRIKSGLWWGLLKISRAPLCPNCKYPVISLAILSLWSGPVGAGSQPEF